MVTGFALIGFYIFVSGHNLTRQAAESFYTYNLMDKKQAARIEVSNRLDEINFERKKIIDAEKKKLYEKINHLAISHLKISKDNYAKISPEQIKIAINEFEKEVVQDKDYLYFAIDTEGVMMRSATDNKIVGNNLYNSKDITGKYFIREIIKAKDQPDGIYVSYYWPKVKGGKAKKKTSYCLYLPELNLIIGTGAYHEDIQSKLQNKIYKRLQSYYENKENYVFVIEYDATARVFSDPKLVGQKISEMTSFDGKSIHQQFMEKIDIDKEGYVAYKYYKKNGIDLTEKISYFHKIEYWGAYIGTGFYLDDLHGEVENYSRIFKKHYYNQALYIISSLFILSIIVFFLFRRGVFLQNESLKQGDIIYKKLFELSHDAIVVVSDKNQLLYENEIAAKLFNKKTSYFFNSDNCCFKDVDKNTCSFEAKNGSARIYYIQIRKKQVFYKQKNSIIYFISDVTKQYLESHALEKMAYIDELTGLPNRRALRNGYDDIYDKVDTDTTCIIGILDIDKFKNINDTYGHYIGDLVLQSLARIFTNRLRQNDAIFRYGGEEFVFLLNNVSLIQAKEIIAGINGYFCESTKQEQSFNCTFSCGMILINNLNKDESLEKQILLADELLYKAKANGRNRIEI